MVETFWRGIVQTASDAKSFRTYKIVSASIIEYTNMMKLASLFLWLWNQYHALGTLFLYSI